MSEWSHLPNARHIDWVLESVRADPEAWAAVWHEVPFAAWGAAKDAAWAAVWAAAGDVARDAARAAVWAAAGDAARSAAWDAAWYAARSATGTLVAFDYAGDILDLPVPAVRLLAASGDPVAALILPAVIVRHGGSDE